MNNLADRIAQLCCEKYNSFGKTGKPQDTEWTVLAGIVLKDAQETLSVVSLATGTKCLSGTELLDTKQWEIGSRLSDSHAEILARRAFLRYLYHQLNLRLNNSNSDVFELDANKTICLRNNISLHYYCSQTPCGDCSIFPKIVENRVFGINASARKRKSHANDNMEIKRLNLQEDYQCDEYDVHRTGAKCVQTGEQDSRLPGVDYHLVGPIRTKPGRGDRTLSLSCSDKIAKWNILGIQGALLSRLIPPVRIDSFCIGGQSPFSPEAMQRGICERFATGRCPVFMQSEQSFVHRKGANRTRPCPSSVIWCAVPDRQLEISVDGRKQGATKKKKRGNYLLISKQELFRTFLRTVDRFNRMTTSEQNHPKKITYYHAKQSSTAYQQSWSGLKLQSFRTWPAKPLYLQDFVLM
ncbi:tRNA-specific adenosine deaminase 1 [Diprion similis]|uniref:tRNA-specific adenosine deaminase 1 n=1 Tax=Diprion similis TaxID=362088 RepID=UPI001EF8DD2F|nr:tRNA-specific adenosine deaminase 1 [Diprion similis]